MLRLNSIWPRVAVFSSTKHFEIFDFKTFISDVVSDFSKLRAFNVKLFIEIADLFFEFFELKRELSK